MDLGLKGKVAAVAAASKGLGRACALAFAREGADVAICARGAEALQETAEAARALGARVHAVALDLAHPGECERFVAETVSELGGIDICVTNAGGPPIGAALSFDDDAYRAALEQNLMVTVRLVRAAVPHMRPKQWGRIVNITSYTVKQPAEAFVLSNTSRAGVAGFAKTVAAEVAPEGITVNTVAPGPILTDRLRALAGITDDASMRAVAGSVPMRRLGTPEEFAAAVVFLASESASFITGVTLQVDGGAVRSLL